MDTTIFVTTIGDERNFSDCMRRLESQTLRVPIEVIDRVAPMSAAFQQMIDRCRTPFYIQVDEDMLLFPHAAETLRNLMEASSPDMALICAPLWDCDMEMTIQGVKIYRHEIVRQFPYRDSVSCEVEQLARIRAAGFQTRNLPLGDPSVRLGEHGKHYRPDTIFARWQRIFEKQRRLGHLDWVDPWPQRLLDRYCETRDRVHLYAFLGAVAGIVGPVAEDAERDFRQRNQAFEELLKYLPETK